VTNYEFHSNRPLIGGILQADCYSGSAMPITPAFARGPSAAGFFRAGRDRENPRDGQKGKQVARSALEAVRRLGALFEVERAINGRSADERRAVRQE
jgi:transposase